MFFFAGNFYFYARGVVDEMGRVVDTGNDGCLNGAAGVAVVCNNVY